jgi:hypothetical protein
MSRIQKSKRYTRILGAISLSLLAAPAVAQAEGCTWLYNGNGKLETALEQSNGYYVAFSTVSQTDGDLTAHVDLILPRRSFNEIDNRVVNTGQIKGRIQRNDISFDVAWNNGGGSGTYRGTIDLNGTASGTTVDGSGGSASWTMQGFHCVVDEPSAETPPASKPVRHLGRRHIDDGNQANLPVRHLGRRHIGGDQPRPPEPPPQSIATAIDDVDIYKGPGGDYDTFPGFMEAQSEAPVLDHQTGWYKLKLNVPGGEGWVAADHLTIKP